MGFHKKNFIGLLACIVEKTFVDRHKIAKSTSFPLYGSTHTHLSTESLGVHSWNENVKDVVTKVEMRKSTKEITETSQRHPGEVLDNKKKKQL